MMVLKRRQVVIIALVLLIAVAGYLNWSYTAPDGRVADNLENFEGELASSTADLGDAKLVDSGMANDFFAQARLDRESSRGKAVDMLNGLISNKNTEKETKEEAEREVMSIASSTDKETQIEGLIKAKGFADAVVYITDESVNIMVRSPEGLTAQDAAKIRDIVMGHTGTAPDKIKIVEVK